MRKTIHHSAVLVVIGATILIPVFLQADEPQPAASVSAGENKAPDQPPKLTDELRALNDLQAAHLLVDYGRRAKSAEALLAAARIYATVPVQPLNVERKEGEPAVKSEPQADMKQRAERLIAEATSLAHELPQPQRDAVNALADALSAQMKVRFRGAPGGPRQIPNQVLRPTEVATYPFDLVGGFTSIQVESLVDPSENLNVRVVGSLSGLEYGSGNTAPNGFVSVNFTHLFVAKVTVIVTNQGVGDVMFTLRTN